MTRAVVPSFFLSVREFHQFVGCSLPQFFEGLLAAGGTFISLAFLGAEILLVVG